MAQEAVKKHYPDVTQNAKFPEIEERILSLWNSQKTFKTSVDRHEAGPNGSNEYVFYDGPPFANGLPHYGHLLTGFVKDAIPRYQTMRGRKVERRFGWDCHGLPAEMEAEKELKISGRQAIQSFGIDKFNEFCKSSVLRYTNEWESYVTRQARWVDFKNDYKTMDLTYMESLLWAFKQLWDKGLIYEGFRVLPYSWACETPLSNFETRMDNSYRPRQDPAITVAFSLLPEKGDPAPLKILAWTTTPWTLPSNLALAVGKDIDYALLRKDEGAFILAESVTAKYEAELKGYEKISSIKGAKLLNRRYEPLFPYFSKTPNAFRIIAADFVNTEEGTGIVHIAPGFGEDDQIVSEANGIQLVCPVDDSGRFTEEVPDFKGQNVIESNKDVIRTLKERKVVIRHESYTHNYPHCWRTDTPLIYKAVSSWYVAVTKFKNRMVELNKEINWIPSHIRDGQFGRWLENARDWSISRNRFWGSPIPVWKSDDPKYPRIDVYGSLDELQRDFGVRPDNLHRPFIDNLTRPNPDDPTGKSKMRRVSDVLDCWFESGSMPFAQVHYPFENKRWFEDHFPADFIVEYVAQTRGWFYTLMVLATAIFDKYPFKNCICHGVVLDENGQKLSKKLKNYPNPEELFKTQGADALRWFFLSSAILRGNDLQIDKEGKLISEIIRTVVNPLWNSYYFFTLYANADGLKGEINYSSNALLDRYILSKTRELVEQTTKDLDGYDIAGACQKITNFIGALNNWYIRRSRERFWKHEIDTDKQNAYNTLYTTLETLCRIMAPLLPLITEEIYRGLTGQNSIHLTDWPDATELPKDDSLVHAMDKIRDICSVGLSLREKHSLRTRLPLKSITVAGKGCSALSPYSALIRDELNVKEVIFSEETGSIAKYKCQVNARVLGPRIGEKIKNVIQDSKSGRWEALNNGKVKISGIELEPGEFTLTLEAMEGSASEPLPSNDAIVILDIKVTKELEEEGIARDLVRAVQQARKDAALHVTDHIKLNLGVSEELKGVLSKFQGYISEQTLSKTILYTAPEQGMFHIEAKIKEEPLQIGISKI